MHQVYMHYKRTLALIVVSLIGWGSAGSAQGTPLKPKAAVASKAQTTPPEMVFTVGEGAITSLAFAPDGKTVAAAEDRHFVKIYDVATTELVRVLSAEAPVGPATYSPDGKLLAVGCGAAAASTHEKPQVPVIQFWNPQTGLPVGAPLTFPEEANPRVLVALAFSPDGKTLAAGAKTGSPSEHNQIGEVIVWDMKTHQVRFDVKAHARPTHALAFSPDSHLLASGGDDGVVKLWDPTTGEIKRTLSPPNNAYSVESLQFFPDGKRLASAGSSGGQNNLWDVESGMLLRHDFGGVYPRFVLLDDGKNAVVGDNNNLILMDVETNRVLSRLSNYGFEIMALSPDGKTLALSSMDGSIRFWNVAPGKERGHLLSGIPSMDSVTTSFSLSPDGNLMALVGLQGIRLWDTQHVRLRYILLGPSLNSINTTAFSPDGSLLLASTYADGIHMWETQGGLELHVFPMRAPVFSPNGDYTFPGRADGVVFSPDGSRFIAPTEKYYRIWNAHTFAIEQNLVADGVPTYAMNFSPDSRTVIAGFMKIEQKERTDRIEFRDVHSGALQMSLTYPREKDGWERIVPPRLLNVPKRSLLASWSRGETTVYFWNMPAGNVVQQLDTGEEGLAGLAFSADGSTMALVGQQGGVSLWDLTTYKLLRQWHGHEAPTTGTAFSPDGKTLYTASGDRTLKLWSVPDGKLRATLRFFYAPYTLLSNAWIMTTPEGYYTASKGAEALFRWRVDGRIYPAARFQQEYDRPDFVQELLKR